MTRPIQPNKTYGVLHTESFFSFLGFVGYITALSKKIPFLSITASLQPVLNPGSIPKIT